MIAFVTLALSFQVSVTCHAATLATTRAASAFFQVTWPPRAPPPPHLARMTHPR